MNRPEQKRPTVADVFLGFALIAVALLLNEESFLFAMLWLLASICLCIASIGWRILAVLMAIQDDLGRDEESMR